MVDKPVFPEDVLTDEELATFKEYESIPDDFAGILADNEPDIYEKVFPPRKHY